MTEEDIVIYSWLTALFIIVSLFLYGQDAQARTPSHHNSSFHHYRLKL